MKDTDYPQVMVSSKETQFVSKDRCTRCPVCEKVFCMPSPGMWTYKITNGHDIRRYFCSYGCSRKGEQIIYPNRFYKGKKITLYGWRDLNLHK